MNIEEKRTAIKNYCERNTLTDGSCSNQCKLYQNYDVLNCYSNRSPAEVEYNFNLIFGELEDTTLIGSDINVGRKYEAAMNYLFKKSVEEDAEKDILITLQTALNYAHEKGKV